MDLSSLEASDILDVKATALSNYNSLRQSVIDLSALEASDISSVKATAVSNYNSLHQSIVDLSNNLAVQVQRESADISLLSQNLNAQI